jgi:uncharacterized protein (TIGR02231 family)
MKFFMLLFLALTLTGAAQVKRPVPAVPVVPVKVQPTDNTIETPVNMVTVYARHALVKRTAELTLPAGEHHLVLGLLPANVRRETIQAGGRGAFSLRDINVVDVLREKSGTERGQALIDALEQMGASLQDLQDQLERLEQEKEYLEKAAEKFLEKREKGGEAVELGPENWLKITRELRQKRAEMDRERRDTERRKTKLEMEKAKTEQELSDLQGKQQEKFPRLELTIDVKAAGRIELELTYLVEGAGWGPQYELQVAGKERTMTVIYQAQVWQNTGEDWRSVRLSLSTANPDLTSKHPDLRPWPVNILPPPPPAPTVMAEANQPGAEGMQQNYQEIVVRANMANTYQVDGSSMADRRSQPPPLPEMELTQADVSSGTTAELYEIDGRSTIVSDNQVHKVGIMTRSLALHFRYSTVPKLSAKAYLKAKAVNTTPYTLLPGQASVFLDQSFVTTTALGRIARDESFWTFLGADDDIQVEYKLLNKTVGDKGFLSKKNTLTFESLITITNRKQTAEEIVVWDQIPLSGDDDVKVTLQKPKYKEDSDQLKMTKANYLEWLYQLQPNEKTEIPLSFTIEYPLGKEITIK